MSQKWRSRGVNKLTLTALGHLLDFNYTQNTCYSGEDGARRGPKQRQNRVKTGSNSARFRSNSARFRSNSARFRSKLGQIRVRHGQIRVRHGQIRGHGLLPLEDTGSCH